MSNEEILRQMQRAFEAGWDARSYTQFQWNTPPKPQFTDAQEAWIHYRFNAITQAKGFGPAMDWLWKVNRYLKS